jgi:hypothetical protein
MNRYSPEYRLAERIVHLEDALGYANKMLTEHNMFGVLPSSSIEFKVYLIKRNKNPDSMRDAEIKRQLGTFMQTYKDSFTKGNVSSVDDFFDSYSND